MLLTFVFQQARQSLHSLFCLYAIHFLPYHFLPTLCTVEVLGKLGNGSPFTNGADTLTTRLPGKALYILR